MNRISILSIVIFNTFTLFGQSTLDSLLQLVDTNKTDVHTIDLYYQIAEQLQKSDNKQSIFYSEKGLTLSAAIKDSNRMAQGLILAGKSLSIMGLYSAAMNKYTECHIIVTKTRDTLLMANLFKNMGSVHWFLKDYNSALLHYKEALTLSKNTHDNLYKSGLLFNIGLSYSNLNQVDSGFFYMDTALVLAYQAKDSTMISHILIHKGGCLLKQELLDKADSYFKKAFKFEKKASSNMNSLLYSDLALLSIKRNQLNKVPDYLSISKEYATKSKSLFATKQYLEIQLQYDSITQNYKSSYNTLKNLMEMKDSLSASDYHDKITSFQTRFDLSQREAEIKILKSENEVYYLKTQQNRLWIGILGLVFLFAMLVIVGIIYSIRLKNKSIITLNTLNVELRAHKEEMTALNEELSMNQEELYEKNKYLESTISQLKAAQNQLIQSEKMASIGILARGVAHELINPLNFINGGISILEDAHNEEATFNEKTDISMKMIHEGIDRAVSIVRQLSTFVDQGNTKPQLTNVNQIIKSTLVFINYKIDLETKLIEEYEEMEDIYCYPDKIHAIMFQLLTNAIDATKKIKADKIIKVTTLQRKNNQKSTFEMSVFNSGNPIDEASLSKIFDPFFTTKDPDKGKGLGLTIAYNMVNELNGTISVKNKEDGVLFTVTFPIVPNL